MLTLNTHSFWDDAKKFEQEWIQIRRFLHRNPELSWQENRTTGYLKVLASSYGLIQVHSISDLTGFFIDIGPLETRKILWRADIDALPIQDKKQVSYASAFDGVAHLCGHDVHATIALGVSRLLKSVPLKKGIRILFQPAEESSPSGAPQVIKRGVVQQADSILALHCDPTLPTGTYGIGIGAQTASFDGFHVTIKVTSTTHSARPHTGKDVIWIANQVMNLWYSMPSRYSDVRYPSVFAITGIQSGTAINVLPDTLTFSGTLRCSNEIERNRLKQKMTDSLISIEHQFDCKAELHFDEGAPAVINHKELSEKTKSVLQQVSSVEDTMQSMGGEDFGWYSQIIPACFIRMGTRESDRTAFPLHHSCFDIDESVIAPACVHIATLLTELANA